MNLRVSKLKASTKSKSQQAAAVGVACTFERYAVWSWGTTRLTGATLRPHGGPPPPGPAPGGVAGRRSGWGLPPALPAGQCTARGAAAGAAPARGGRGVSLG